MMTLSNKIWKTPMKEMKSQNFPYKQGKGPRQVRRITRVRIKGGVIEGITSLRNGKRLGSYLLSQVV